jgi:hypothetical protein
MDGVIVNGTVSDVTIISHGQDITDRCSIDIMTGKIYIPATMTDVSILSKYITRTRDILSNPYEDIIKQVQKQIDLQQDWRPSLKRLKHKPKKKPSKLILALIKNVKTT